MPLPLPGPPPSAPGPPCPSQRRSRAPEPSPPRLTGCGLFLLLSRPSGSPILAEPQSSLSPLLPVPFPGSPPPPPPPNWSLRPGEDLCPLRDLCAVSPFWLGGENGGHGGGGESSSPRATCSSRPQGVSARQPGAGPGRACGVRARDKDAFPTQQGWDLGGRPSASHTWAAHRGGNPRQGLFKVWLP